MSNDMENPSAGGKLKKVHKMESSTEEIFARLTGEPEKPIIDLEEGKDISIVKEGEKKSLEDKN